MLWKSISSTTQLPQKKTEAFKGTEITAFFSEFSFYLPCKSKSFILCALFHALEVLKTQDSYLLQDIPVELFLSIAEELPDHLPAQALPLQEKVSHTDRRVGDEPPLSQVLDAFFWLPERNTWANVNCQ